MKKGILYFYKDKPFYVSGIIGLYLGMSLFMFASISEIGQGVVLIASLIFTGSIVKFIVSKEQTAKETAGLLLIFLLMVSCNFYSHLLSNQQMYPLVFITLHLSSIISFCVFYNYVLLRDKLYIAFRVILFTGLLLFFGYAYTLLSLPFWHSGALTIFTLIQAACIVPMFLIVRKKQQIFSMYQQLEYGFFTGKIMILHAAMFLIFLLLWDFFYVFLVYQDIMKQFF